MKIYTGIDLGSTTTKAVILDEEGEVLGRGITNSRSNYDLAARISRSEAEISARFELLERALKKEEDEEAVQRFLPRLQRAFRKEQELVQIELLKDICLDECNNPRVAAVKGPLSEKIAAMMGEMTAEIAKPDPLAIVKKEKKTSDFFRDRAASKFSRMAEKHADLVVDFDTFMSIFDKAIIRVESTEIEGGFAVVVLKALVAVTKRMDDLKSAKYRAAVESAADLELVDAGVIGTGYGRQRLPFPKDCIRSEILCHGLGAHHQFPNTRTVLDIGGQDTKAIQIDGRGIVTSFQMNDRCAAGCGRYLGYIADEMSLGVHELGPMAMKSERRVKISSTCTVFAGAELRDRLTNGQRQEDILAGLHRAIILRAMSLLARSGGVENEFTFTGGVANNEAAVSALRQLITENYGERVLNISAGSIYTGALGAALFCRRAEQEREAA